MVAALLPGMVWAQDADQVDAPAPQPTYVRTMVVEAPDAMLTRQFFGRVAARDTVDLAFEVGGRLVALDAVEGARVAAGTELAALDLDPFERAVERAELTLAQAERDLVRARALTARNAAAPVTAEDAETARDLADVALRDARAALADARLTAPFDGLIADRIASNNTIIEAGQTIVRVHDMSELRVEFDLPERLVAQVGDPDAVNFTALLPGDDTELTLSFREFRAETGTVGQSYTLSLAVVGDAPRLLPGQAMIVRVAVPGPDARPVVPTGAVATTPDGATYVVAVEGAGDGMVARHRPVDVAAPTGSDLVVDGLAEGVEIVSVGAHAVADGARLARFQGLTTGTE